MRWAWLVAVLALAGCGGAGPAVVAHDDRGDRIARADLGASGRFALAYRHSYFRAPAEERFRATGDGFVLEAIASPHAGVLDYYELPGSRIREGAMWVLRPTAPPRFPRLALAGTATGRRTLIADGRRLPLWGPRARHLTITVEGG